MEWIGMGLLAAAAVIFAVTAYVIYRQKRKLCRMVDQMLDELLDGKPMEQTDLREGEISALSGKASRLQGKMQAEVGQADREKEQVKSLISDMSHQLKTPLANLVVYEEILETEEVSQEERRKFLGRMRAQLDKVNWILNSLFKMVKLEENVITFEAEENPIRSTLLEAVNAVYEKAEKKQIEIQTERFLDCSLYHNPKWTAEVFTNILENAVKYTPESGRISIGMRRFELYTEIRIQDTGIGIAQEEMTEIFKRFYRSREVENVEGSGIGLYLSKLILEKEKGYMNVASRQGKGSCFSVFLQNCRK